VGVWRYQLVAERPWLGWGAGRVSVIYTRCAQASAWPIPTNLPIDLP